MSSKNAKPTNIPRAPGSGNEVLTPEAMRDFGELSEWQMQETRNGLKEADKGDFASEQAVEETLTRFLEPK